MVTVQIRFTISIDGDRRSQLNNSIASIPAKTTSINTDHSLALNVKDIGDIDSDRVVYEFEKTLKNAGLLGPDSKLNVVRKEKK